MSLQEKIRKVLHKTPYVHDTDDVWAQIEAQLPKKDNNRPLPFIFLLFAVMLVGIWYYHNTQIGSEVNTSAVISQSQNDKISYSSDINTKAIKSNNVLSKSNANELSLIKNASDNSTQSTIQNISGSSSFSKQNTSSINGKSTSKFLKIVKNQSNDSSNPPLSVTLTTTIPFSQTDVAPQFPSIDFIAKAQTTFEKVKPSETPTLSANTDADVGVFDESRSPHVILNSKLLLSHLQLFDVPKHGFNLLPKIPIKVNEHSAKSPWTVSVATFAFEPIRELKGQNEYVEYKTQTETSDLSFMVSIIANRSIYKNLKGNVGLQYDAINEYHQGKSTTTRNEKINSDSASYYIFNAKPVYFSGELSKTITEGKQFKAPNILQRWSIPVSLSYQFPLARKWNIEPNIGLCYTFHQRFDGITIDEEGTYLIHNKDAFSKMYAGSNLLSIQSGISTSYRFTTKLGLDVKYHFGRDLQNILLSTDNSITYTRHAFGLGFSYLIR